jgi:rubrerythrin
MTLTAVLDEAIQLEEKIRSCYELLSKVTEDGVSAELKQLAREEKSHVNVLKTGKNFVFRTPDQFGQETISDNEIRLGLKAVAGLEEDLISRKTEFSLGLKKLYGLEKKFERVHMNTAVEFKDFSLKKLFEALARADAEHRQRLERLIAQL